MAVTRRTSSSKSVAAGKNSSAGILNLTKMTKKVKSFFKFSNLWDLIVNPQRCLPMAILLFLAEIAINAVVIAKVNYTEIDWIAYMQEVEGVTNGTYDYSLLKGDTGPLVYPAGFVWIYTGLYYATNLGKNIKLAQCFFAVLYLAFMALVFRLMIKSRKVPPYALAIMSLTSYRVHSIFILRLFNDPVAMFFLYLAINLFSDDYWSLGSLAFSLAVSVKMNVLLFAPALLQAYIATQGFMGTIKQLAICAIPQFILAAPFLAENPLSYMKGSFDLGRIFLHQWSVNWRFLPEWIFVHKGFHAGLLFAHIFLLTVAAGPFWQLLSGLAKLKDGQQNRPQWTIQLLLLPMFMANFIGIAVSRSLHYQFYIWYYHQLSYLLWCTSLPVQGKLLILGLIELCWNTFPSTDWSSATLHGCHFVILISLFMYLRKIQKESKEHLK
jgi:alpha-1,3-mannosyltransferase